MPKLKPGDGGGGGEALPASEYILALTWFTRKQSKSSRMDYIRGRFEVCAGPLKGRGFYAVLSCDLSKQGTVIRWQILMEACGVTEEFEIGDSREGTDAEGDRDIARLFKNRPFKATVKREQSGQYVNNDIEMIHYRRSLSDQDNFEITQWLDEHRGKSGGGRGGGWDENPPPPDDAEPPPAAYDEFGSEYEEPEYVPPPHMPPDDDDIPF